MTAISAVNKIRANAQLSVAIASIIQFILPLH